MALQLGLIGAGMIANVHAKGAAAAGGTIAAAWDPRIEAAESLVTEHGGEAVESLDALLARDDVQAVVVAVPNHLHAELAILALRAGKDVLLEKPMATTVAACDEVIAVAAAGESILQLGFVCRFAPTICAARGLIEDGVIGSVHHARATLLRRRGIPGLGGWFTTKELSGGGCLIDIGVHLIDLVMHLARPGRALRASGHCQAVLGGDAAYDYDEMWSTPVEGGTFDVEDGVRAMLRFETGMTLDLNVTWATHLPEGQMRDGIVLEGDKGAMLIDIWGDSLLVGDLQDGKAAERTIAVEVGDAWDDAFKGEHESFAAAVASRSVAAADAAQGRHVQQIVDAIYTSDQRMEEVAIVD